MEGEAGGDGAGDRNQESNHSSTEHVNQGLPREEIRRLPHDYHTGAGNFGAAPQFTIGQNNKPRYGGGAHIYVTQGCE